LVKRLWLYFFNKDLDHLPKSMHKRYGEMGAYDELTHKSVIWRTQRLYCPYSMRVSSALQSS
jgi:hypothetical protein